HTLELTALADDPDVLELGCAEGHFTRLLAPTSKRVLAMDISQTAVARARQRCRDLPNTDFRCLDLAREPLPGTFDLVVCSEVLYYLGSRLPRALANISKCLKPGGLLVTTNANQIGDEPSRTGFDWGHECGAHTIGKMIQAIDGFTLEREIRTPLYRVQAFRWRGDAAAEARIDERALDIALEDRLARAVVWGGGESRISTLKREFSVSIPILVYHRVAPDGDGPPGLDRYRTTPQAFENQISFLRRHGYWGLTIRQLTRALEKKMPLPGRPVMLTFDDGYSDFATHAWPVLEKHDFPATLFVVPAKVGGCADWDSEFGPPAPLLGWEQLAELARRGVEIESHAFTHRSLARLELAEVYRECLYSHAAVERGIGRAPTAICYPFGAQDRVVEQIAFESGYSLGFTANVGLAHVTSAKMSLPRLEVSGRDDLQTFARKLNPA
ncbi:MAG: hypothetical protein JWO72_3199, partial [Caulobacteraceae bacterium]|nr:hypothetical protein [Caulobacteraceae bacterium]